MILHLVFSEQFQYPVITRLQGRKSVSYAIRLDKGLPRNLKAST